MKQKNNCRLVTTMKKILPLDELYAYCAIDEHGEEGVIAFQTPSGLLQAAFGPIDRVARDRLTMLARESAKKTGRVVILRKYSLDQAVAIICPQCGRVSHNPHDAENLYCGNCHVFFADQGHSNSQLERGA